MNNICPKCGIKLEILKKYYNIEIEDPNELGLKWLFGKASLNNDIKNGCDLCGAPAEVLGVYKL